MSMSTQGSIKGYELLELIGEGAYGAVYRARQEFIDREFWSGEREMFGLPPREE